MKTHQFRIILILAGALAATTSYANSAAASSVAVSLAPPIGVPRHHFHHLGGGPFCAQPFAGAYAYSYYGNPYYDYGYPPYAYSPPYYYPRYMRDDAYPGYYPYTVYDLGNQNSGTGSANQPATTYYQLGHHWAQDLRQDIVTWDQFVASVQKWLTDATPGAREEFRRVFASAYGTNGDAALDKALVQAGLLTPSE